MFIDSYKQCEKCSESICNDCVQKVMRDSKFANELFHDCHGTHLILHGVKGSGVDLEAASRDWLSKVHKYNECRIGHKDRANDDTESNWFVISGADTLFNTVNDLNKEFGAGTHWMEYR